MLRSSVLTLLCAVALTSQAYAQVRDSTPNGIGVSNRSKSFGNRNSGGQPNTGSDFVSQLTEQNILAFMREVSDIATGNKPEMLDDEVGDYLNNHVANAATFESTMNHHIPGFPAKDINLKIGKQEYINSIIKGRYTLQDYSTRIVVEDLAITNGGKRATFTSITDEQGLMPFPKNENNPEDLELLPIKGQSKCQQTMIVSFNNFIQMADAKCHTEISFDPFAGKPLIPD